MNISIEIKIVDIDYYKKKKNTNFLLMEKKLIRKKWLQIEIILM